MKRQGYDAAQIAMAIEKATFELPTTELKEPEHFDAPQELTYYEPPEDENPIELSLTDEDKMALRLKWGKTYKPEEWV
jgi:hypothetical protein